MIQITMVLSPLKASEHYLTWMVKHEIKKDIFYVWILRESIFITNVHFIFWVFIIASSNYYYYYFLLLLLWILIMTLLLFYLIVVLLFLIIMSSYDIVVIIIIASYYTFYAKYTLTIKVTWNWNKVVMSDDC